MTNLEIPQIVSFASGAPKIGRLVIGSTEANFKINRFSTFPKFTRFARFCTDLKNNYNLFFRILFSRDASMNSENKEKKNGHGEVRTPVKDGGDCFFVFVFALRAFRKFFVY